MRNSFITWHAEYGTIVTGSGWSSILPLPRSRLRAHLDWIHGLVAHGCFQRFAPFFSKVIGSVSSSSTPALRRLVVILLLLIPHQLVALISPRRSANGVDCRRSYGIWIHLRQACLPKGARLCVARCTFSTSSGGMIIMSCR